MSDQGDPKGYWKSSILIVSIILSIWFFVSYVCGILCRDWMDINMPSIGNAKFGFWMAQQGSIICFVLLLVLYAFLMNRLDKKHGYDEEEDS
jgi:putative solute:sodium symporter small subunit